jgi:FKBP-type peptidyl-prolyl cis-trans isomerase
MTILRNAALALPLTLGLAVPGLAQDTAPLESDIDRFSYALGVLYGQDISGQLNGIEINPDNLTAAFTSSLTGGETLMTREEAQATLQEVFPKLQAEIMAARMAEAKAFLEENAQREDVTVTESGLQYRVLAEGEGDSPTPTDQVVVHYTGRLLDGTVFDSSVERGEPATFPVGGVIPGWTEALQLMKPGGKLEVWLPPEIAYGAQGAGGAIGPNETLTFEMELIEVVSAN